MAKQVNNQVLRLLAALKKKFLNLDYTPLLVQCLIGWMQIYLCFLIFFTGFLVNKKKKSTVLPLVLRTGPRIYIVLIPFETETNVLSRLVEMLAYK